MRSRPARSSAYTAMLVEEHTMDHIVIAVMAAFVPVLIFLVTWVHSQGASIHMPFYRVDPDGWH